MWKYWIGLPHKFRANPRDGIGADCLLMVWNVLEDFDAPYPHFDHAWLDLAENGRHRLLAQLYRQLTIPLDAPEDCAVTLFSTDKTIGIAIVVDGGLLYVHHRRGVQWLPLGRCKKLEFRKFK